MLVERIPKAEGVILTANVMYRGAEAHSVKSIGHSAVIDSLEEIGTQVQGNFSQQLYLLLNSMDPSGLNLRRDR